MVTVTRYTRTENNVRDYAEALAMRFQEKQDLNIYYLFIITYQFLSTIG